MLYRGCVPCNWAVHLFSDEKLYTIFNLNWTVLFISNFVFHAKYISIYILEVILNITKYIAQVMYCNCDEAFLHTAILSNNWIFTNAYRNLAPIVEEEPSHPMPLTSPLCSKLVLIYASICSFYHSSSIWLHPRVINCGSIFRFLCSVLIVLITVFIWSVSMIRLLITHLVPLNVS